MPKPVILASPDTNGRPTYHEQVRAFRKHLIEQTLVEHGGNRSRTARTLGLSRTYLLRLIRELGVTGPPPRPLSPRAGSPRRFLPHRTRLDPVRTSKSVGNDRVYLLQGAHA